MKNSFQIVKPLTKWRAPRPSVSHRVALVMVLAVMSAVAFIP